MTTPKEHPILYSAPMVSAYLAGTKTVTRRILKLPPWVADVDAAIYKLNEMAKRGEVPGLALMEDGLPTKRFSCPFGGNSDRLWGRETWQYLKPEDGGPEGPCYAATGHDPSCKEHGHLWRPSIFMPRWASRMLAEVVSVRVERVQSISEADAIAEGVYSWADSEDGAKLLDKIGWGNYSWPRILFEKLWMSINGQESWDANPWVWRVEFRRIEAEVREQVAAVRR